MIPVRCNYKPMQTRSCMKYVWRDGLCWTHHPDGRKPGTGERFVWQPNRRTK